MISSVFQKSIRHYIEYRKSITLLGIKTWSIQYWIIERKLVFRFKQDHFNEDQ